MDNGTTFNGHVDYGEFVGDWVLVPTSDHSCDVAEFCAELAAWTSTSHHYTCKEEHPWKL